MGSYTVKQALTTENLFSSITNIHARGDMQDSPDGSGIFNIAPMKAKSKCRTVKFDKDELASIKCHHFENACLDGSQQFFASGKECRNESNLPVEGRSRFLLKPMPQNLEKVEGRLLGTGFVIDCFSSKGNPSHTFMAVVQACRLVEIAQYTQTRIEWVITRGCSMHAGASVSGALQMVLDNIIFSSRFVSKHALVWDIPIGTNTTVCFDHAILKTDYSGFPPPRWRSFITQRLNPLIGFVPSTVRPCKGPTNSVRVGVYYRSGTSDVTKLRRMCNLGSVLEGLGALLGPASVAAFTTNESLSLRAQIDLFEAHDILVGPHGSHWAISWFAERPRVIIEVTALPSAR